jgi:hypothetical protein
MDARGQLRGAFKMQEKNHSERKKEKKMHYRE